MHFSDRRSPCRTRLREVRAGAPRTTDEGWPKRGNRGTTAAPPTSGRRHGGRPFSSLARLQADLARSLGPVSPRPAPRPPPPLAGWPRWWRAATQTREAMSRPGACRVARARPGPRCAGHPRGASAGPPAGRALGPVVSSRRGAQGAQGPRPVPVAARGARWGHRRGAPAARCPPSRSRRWVAGHRSCPVPPPCAGGAGHRCCRHV